MQRVCAQGFGAVRLQSLRGGLPRALGVVLPALIGLVLAGGPGMARRGTGLGPMAEGLAHEGMRTDASQPSGKPGEPLGFHEAARGAGPLVAGIDRSRKPCVPALEPSDAAPRASPAHGATARPFADRQSVRLDALEALLRSGGGSVFRTPTHGGKDALPRARMVVKEPLLEPGRIEVRRVCIADHELGQT